jgi:hypothetical protein
VPKRHDTAATGRRKLRNHPYAELFPMMTATELEALSEDIAANGLRHPIVTYQGAVLDGRNRLLACEKASVEPRFEEYDGDDPLGLVISLNVQRRDLTRAQRAIVAARALPAFEEEALKRKAEGGRSKTVLNNGKPRRSAADAATVFKVGRQAVEQAKALLASAQDLAEQVESCALSLAAAYEQLQQRRRDATQKVKDAIRAAKYADAISRGEITPAEALQRVMQDEREEAGQARYDAARQAWLQKLAEVGAWVEQSTASLLGQTLAEPPAETMPIRDGLGRLVPERLRGVFASRWLFDLALRELEHLSESVHAAAESEAGHYLRRRLAEMDAALVRLKEALEESRPYSITCSACQNKDDNCAACGGEFWESAGKRGKPR